LSTALPETPAPTPLTQRFFGILAGLAVVLALWVAFWRLNAFSFFVYDDTFIVLRYAKNFLEHGQLAWNLGEAVEGYTNPLHLGLITILGGCGVDLLAAARAINAAAYAAFAAVLFLSLRKRSGFSAAILIAGLSLANPAMIAWVWGGMEVPLSVFLLAVPQALMMRAILDPPQRTRENAILTAIFFGLAFWNRPDNALYAVPAALMWFLWKERKNTQLFGGIFAGMVAAHTVIRLIFYGDVVPNTFYAKVTGTPAVTLANGLQYVWEGIATSPYYYAVGFAALAAMMLYRKPLRAFAFYALGSIALGMAYVISIGGDFMPGHRFIMPWLPLCLLSIGLLLENVKPALRYAGLIGCLLIMKAIFILPDDLRGVDGTAMAGEKVGDYIQANWPKGSLVALNAAGAIPYKNMDKTFIDMLGLNDRHIAHRKMPDLKIEWQHKPGHGKGDGAYVLSRQPDYIILSSIAGDNGFDTPVLPSDVELMGSAEFKRCYKQEKTKISWPDVILRQNTTAEKDFTFAYYHRTCPKA